jgi:hypothetical protein
MQMTPFPSEEKGLAPQRNVNARARDLGVHRWRCLPLSHTLFNPLTYDLSHQSSYQPGVCETRARSVRVTCVEKPS